MLNKVQLIGRITHDLDKQYLKINNEQVPKIDFQLAVNQTKDIVQYIPCVVFRTQAENMHKYLHKGSKVYLEGILSIQKYTNNEGQKKATTKVIVNNVLFLDNKHQTDNLPF